MIYYVEDDTNIRDLTVYALRQAGLRGGGLCRRGRLLRCVQGAPARTGAAGHHAARSGRLGDSAHAAGGRGRRATCRSMMLTAKGTEFDTVCGLDAGADDYLAKPFGMMVAGVARRERAACAAPPAPAVACRRRVGVRPPSRSRCRRTTVWRGRRDRCDARSRSSTFCARSCRTRGTCCRVGQLLEDVWGVTHVGETRTVDVHIQTLRQKLAAAGAGCRRLDPDGARRGLLRQAATSLRMRGLPRRGGAGRQRPHAVPTHLRV